MKLRTAALALASLALPALISISAAAPASAAAAHPAGGHLAAPVKVARTSPLILHPYYIQSADYGTYMIGVNAGDRVSLIAGEFKAFEQTSSSPYSYGGHLWYQWADTLNTANCLQTSSQGSAHLVLEPCSGTNEEQFFYNNALTSSEFLNLESTVFEGTNYGAWAENSSALAVNKWTSSITFKWNFASG